MLTMHRDRWAAELVERSDACEEIRDNVLKELGKYLVHVGDAKLTQRKKWWTIVPTSILYLPSKEIIIETSPFSLGHLFSVALLELLGKPASTTAVTGTPRHQSRIDQAIAPWNLHYTQQPNQFTPTQHWKLRLHLLRKLMQNIALLIRTVKLLCVVAQRDCLMLDLHKVCVRRRRVLTMSMRSGLV